MALVAFAPTLATISPVASWWIARIVPKFPGDLRVESVSIGWFTPVRVENLEITDAAGKTVVLVPALVGDRSLLALLWDRADLGTFRVERPRFHIVCTSQSTNLEDILAGLLPNEAAPAEAPTREGLALRIECVEAAITLRDDTTAREWQIAPITVQATLPGDRTQPAQVRLTGAVLDATRRGQVLVELEDRLVSEGNELSHTGRLKARVEELALAPFEPLLRRLDPALRVQGQADLELDCAWVGEGLPKPRRRMEGVLRVRDLTLAAPGLEESLRLARVDVPFRIQGEGSWLTVERAELACDLGQATARGTLNLEQPPLAWLSTPGYEVRGEIDLARVGEHLPRTIRLRDNTRITDGKVSFRAGSSAGPSGVVWNSEVRTSPLAGVAQGQRFTWPEPLTLVVQARHPPESLPVVEKLLCESNFLRIEGAGSLDLLNATAHYDLDRLAAQLARFLDLGSLKLAGQGTTTVKIQRGANGQVAANVDARLQRLEVVGFGTRPLREEGLALLLQATGQADENGVRRLDTASLRVQGARADQDALEVELLQPVTDPARGPWGPARVQARGDLGQWQRRLGALTSALDGFQLAGRGELTAQVRGTPQLVVVDEAKVALRELRCEGEGLWISEPILDLKTAGQLEIASGKLELRDLLLTGTSVALHAPHVQVSSGPNGVDVIGRAGLRGDLARWWRWLDDPRAAPSASLRGQLVAQVELRATDTRLDGMVDATVANLTYGPSASPVWSEPQVRLTLRGHHDLKQDQIEIASARLETAALTGEAAGRVGRVRGSRDLALAGKLQYDLEKLAPLWRPYVGESVQVSGRDTRPFQVQGSLAPAGTARPATVTLGPATALATLRGEAGLGWGQIRAYGFDAGPAEVRLRLQDGWLRVEPMECSVSGGKLRMEPSLRLEPGPQELHLARGTAVERVRMTPRMCSGWLGFVAPALAGVTEVEGQMSATLDSGRVPLADPTAADVQGRLTLHNARVGPSPLIRELGVLLKVPHAANLARESVVSFQMANGRVHHQGLELVFPDLTLRTSGSVGLDGSLALVAEMPVPPRWLGGGRINATLAKQTVRLPIGGTLAAPKLDEKALRSAAAQFARAAAGEALEQEFNSQLNRLLKPKK